MPSQTSFTSALAVAAVLCAAAQGQTCGYLGWRQVSTTTLSATGPRHSFMMVYDSQTARTLLYGGASGRFPDYIEFSDIRVLEGNAWRELPVQFAAPKRWELGMSYDSTRGVIVLNGGASFVGVAGNVNNHHIGGTYEFDGGNWGVKTFSGPIARHGAGMGYDSWRGRTVLFGGKHNVPGTWEWDGTAWTDRNPPGPVPSPRGFVGMAFDPVRGKLVMFGGGTDSFVPLGDTWEWDGSTWAQTAVTGPPARLGPLMVWDSFRKIMVLHGGQDNVQGRRNDLWEYRAGVWTAVTVAGSQPPLRYMGGFAYDSHRNRYIAAGGQTLQEGQTDTWELRGNPYIALPPADVSVAADSTANLRVGVESTASTTLRWRRNGVAMSDGGRVSGSATGSLVISGAAAADAGTYNVIITTACGSFLTAAATLEVRCPADYNQDGGVDGSDVESYFEAWVLATADADFNQDGGVDGSDVEVFFTRWTNGC